MKLRYKIIAAAILLAPVGAYASSTQQPQTKSKSIAIVGARIIDGTGGPSRYEVVRIRSGVVIAMGKNIQRKGDQIIDGRGMILAPGVIDTHSHHDEDNIGDVSRI
jgi:N-acyl-D-amino-acid deacylase